MKFPLKIADVWLALTAAEARSSDRWVVNANPGGYPIVYSPSLGPARVVVQIAEAAQHGFAEYIARVDPSSVRKLLNIVQAASELKDIHLEPPARTLETVDDRTDRMMAALKKLVEAFAEVEMPK